jgi:hypothetical protein
MVAFAESGSLFGLQPVASSLHLQGHSFQLAVSGDCLQQSNDSLYAACSSHCSLPRTSVAMILDFLAAAGIRQTTAQSSN